MLSTQSDLPGGKRYPLFEQPRPDVHRMWRAWRLEDSAVSCIMQALGPLARWHSAHRAKKTQRMALASMYVKLPSAFYGFNEIPQYFTSRYIWFCLYSPTTRVQMSHQNEQMNFWGKKQVDFFVVVLVLGFEKQMKWNAMMWKTRMSSLLKQLYLDVSVRILSPIFQRHLKYRNYFKAPGETSKERNSRMKKLSDKELVVVTFHTYL